MSKTADDRKNIRFSPEAHLWFAEYQLGEQRKGKAKPSQESILGMLTERFDKTRKIAHLLDAPKEQLHAALPDLTDEQIALANQFLQWINDEAHEDAVKGLIEFVVRSVERHGKKM